MKTVAETIMSLETLHHRLADLRGRLLSIRRGAAVCGLGVTAGLLLLAAFWIDWTWRFPLFARAILLMLMAAAVTWRFLRDAWPQLRRRETDEELALQVERRHQIDSDLVAALQFQRQSARPPGSSELMQAVVDYVAEFSPSLPIDDLASYAPLKRRGGALAGVAALIALIAVLAPQHAQAFLNRLCLGSARYPTATRIESIQLNDERFDAHATPPTTTLVRPGRPVVVTVSAAGVMPREGRLWIREHGGSPTSTPLVPENVQSDVPNNNAEHQSASSRLASSADSIRPATIYRAQLASVSTPLTCWIELGDDESSPWYIDLSVPPLVDLELDVSPPDYARNVTDAVAPAAGQHQRSVLEGSTVNVTVRCSNKPLARVSLDVEGTSFPLTSSDDGRVWKLVGESPFAPVLSPVKFTVVAIDVAGLEPDERIVGYIRTKLDRPPRVAAAVVSRKVVPSARPRVTFGAVDDFGIGRIVAVLHVVRAKGTSSEERFVREIRPDDPAAPLEPIVRGEHPLDLSPFKLEPGDELRVTLEAVDRRGARPGKTGSSEALILTVTDRAGILAGLMEADQQSAKQLDRIIERELGIGGSR